MRCCHATGAGDAKSRIICEKMDRNVNATYKDTYMDTYKLPFGRFRLPPACAVTQRAISWAHAVHLDQLRRDNNYLLRAPPARPASTHPPPRGTPCTRSSGAGAGRCSLPRTPCTCSSGAGAGRGPPPRTPCTCSSGAGAGTGFAASCSRCLPLLHRPHRGPSVCGRGVGRPLSARRPFFFRR